MWTSAKMAICCGLAGIWIAVDIFDWQADESRELRLAVFTLLQVASVAGLAAALFPLRTGMYVSKLKYELIAEATQKPVLLETSLTSETQLDQVLDMPPVRAFVHAAVLHCTAPDWDKKPLQAHLDRERMLDEQLRLSEAARLAADDVTVKTVQAGLQKIAEEGDKMREAARIAAEAQTAKCAEILRAAGEAQVVCISDVSAKVVEGIMDATSRLQATLTPRKRKTPKKVAAKKVCMHPGCGATTNLIRVPDVVSSTGYPARDAWTCLPHHAWVLERQQGVADKELSEGQACANAPVSKKEATVQV